MFYFECSGCNKVFSCEGYFKDVKCIPCFVCDICINVPILPCNVKEVTDKKIICKVKLLGEYYDG